MPKEEYANLGDVCRSRLNMQAQYGCHYVRGTQGCVILGSGLRFKGDERDYHGMEIHVDDVEIFVTRVLEWRESLNEV